MSRSALNNLDKLVTYCAWRILQRKEECTFERLTVECFKLFPERFSLRSYPEYPDSATVNRSWLRCRTDRGWLVGNVKTSFRLSDAGVRVALEVAKELEKTGSHRSISLKQPTRDRTREEALMRALRNHDAFKQFIASPETFSPTMNQIYSIASCTLETPRVVVKENLMQLLEIAKRISDNRVASFIQICLEAFQKQVRSKRGNARCRIKKKKAQ